MDWSISLSGVQTVQLIPLITKAGVYNFTITINGKICVPSVSITIIPRQTLPSSSSSSTTTTSSTSSTSFTPMVGGATMLVYWGEGLLGSRTGEVKDVYVRKEDIYGNIMYVLIILVLI